MKYGFLILCVSLLVSCGGSGAPKKEARVQRTRAVGRVISLVPSESARIDTIHLGLMRSGEVVRQELTLCNKTPSVLVITSVTTSCGCTSVEYVRHPIPVNKEVPFTFEFDSRGMSGYQIKHITLKTTQPTVTAFLVMTADVI